ncbi:MAG: UDP-glucose/GDP-mannose dehydrogenase family protein [Candidatus Omnitrophica bacterium]|nr:UDP-glucose/GDP-mannose dehydrogenase family protein [Candidatus Omnitrophota bacterium]
MVHRYFLFLGLKLSLKWNLILIELTIGLDNIAIIGSGYVGLVTGACFAELGNKVICTDNDSKKIASLKKGILPIYEPGLKELIANNVKNKRLSFITSIKDAVLSSEVIFIAVGTTALENGEADLTGIENVARNIAINMKGYRLIVEKSTVPVETGERVKHTIRTHLKGNKKFDIASNPEFLREGTAINDFMHPDRIVIGVESKKAEDLLVNLYNPLNATIVVTNIKSAELIKHASNAFLATKISFINAVSRICDKVGADVQLNAGLGYGGSCFPKDLDAFLAITGHLGYDFQLLKAVKTINEEQKNFIIKKIKDTLWVVKDKTIGILGLAFKPDTDDVRNAPALDLIYALQQEGAKIKVYDPQAMPKAKSVLKNVTFCADSYAVCRGSDCLFIATEWNEFKELDFLKIKKLLKRPLIIDGRNIYEAKSLEKLGFRYISIGRKSI